MYVIIDWQNEDDIQVLKNTGGKTIRKERIEDITNVLVFESNRTGNRYLKIVKFDS